MNRLATLTALAFVAVAGGAQAAPTTYVIDGQHTFAYFTYDHLNLTNQTHGFRKVSGKIVLDSDTASGSAEVVLDVKSIDTGYPKFNEALLGSDFFDAAKFPTMSYKASKFNYSGSALQTVEGELTIKGVTKPLIFAVNYFNCKQHPVLKKDACGANLISQISRTAFGLGKFTPGVGDDVTLNIVVEAIKQ